MSEITQLLQQSPSSPVFVIGKGPSLDEIALDALPSGLVINLNDSEKIHPGHIGIFSGGWVRAGLQESGYRCQHYLAGQPLPPSVPHTVLPKVPAELNHADMNTLRLERSEFFDEPFVLLNAIKVALALHRDSGVPIEVYFLGFDFSLVGGSASSRAGEDRSGVEIRERQAIITSQEAEFIQLFHYFGKRNRLVLHHVGDKTYSTHTPHRFNRVVCGRGLDGFEPIRLANPDRVLVVAEFTNNHLGDPARLVEMIERAKEAGADLIKVQKRHVDSFYSQEQLESYYWSPFGESLGAYRRGVELNDGMLDLLDETCRKMEIEWFCSILDLPSFEALERFQPRLIKVPSTISNHRDYHRKLASRYHGAVVVSTGFTEGEYVDHVLDTYQENEVIYLLHCVSAYPTALKDCNLAVIREYDHLARRTERPRIIPGYSSHDLGSIGCMLAVASGARMLEKHVKLGDVEWVHFDKVAIDLTGTEFASFVSDVRRAEEIFGSGEKQVLPCEHHKYKVVR